MTAAVDDSVGTEGDEPAAAGATDRTVAGIVGRPAVGPGGRVAGRAGDGVTDTVDGRSLDEGPGVPQPVRTMAAATAHMAADASGGFLVGSLDEFLTSMAWANRTYADLITGGESLSSDLPIR